MELSNDEIMKKIYNVQLKVGERIKESIELRLRTQYQTLKSLGTPDDELMLNLLVQSSFDSFNWAVVEVLRVLWDAEDA